MLEITILTIIFIITLNNCPAKKKDIDSCLQNDTKFQKTCLFSSSLGRGVCLKGQIRPLWIRPYYYYSYCALLILTAAGRVHLVNDLLQVLSYTLQLWVYVLSHLETRGITQRGGVGEERERERERESAILHACLMERDKTMRKQFRVTSYFWV